ncbi:class I SAM-dependent methyltransferase [Catenovulum sediminis]|uniref:class I SAM-dependent methyltransferase n=1 Tax=Catenovulum sediminis TaxID=1740262 RepID=UPI00117C98F4|nr:class I SAM-dependent methyltransferase [Catenovulum sediminis]
MLQHIKIPHNLECQRLFHGRGHAHPGYEHICIDWFAPVILITAYKSIESDLLARLIEFLHTQIDLCQSIQLQHRYLPKAPIDCIWGDELDVVIAEESGLKYHISLGQNQNHGLFLDMKNGRDWVKENSAGKVVLNLFAYTCAFSVAAIAGGADKVVNLDMSKSALRKGRENHILNEQAIAEYAVRYEAVDLFKSFGRVKKHGPYDLVICDPPAFQKGSVNIERDYKKIIRRLPEFVNDHTQVLLCLNSPDLDVDFLTNTVAEYCPQLTYQDTILPPAVFKEAYAGKGLKVLRFEFND